MSARASKKAKKEDRPRRPWRESIEGITVAIVMAVFLKYFIVEAYKIPSGSMQPTLMGSPATGIFDRILVDKLSYHLRDPKRFEVVVFKHPLQRSLNMIKRIVGVGGESLKIEHGDLWTRGADDSDWKILRRPEPVQRDMWRSLRTSGVWRPSPDTSGWLTDGSSIAARGNGRAIFPGVVGSVRNGYVDGYPEEIAAVIRRRPEKTGKYAVGDLRVEADLTALDGLTAVRVELFEGNRRYSFQLPGPGAAEDRPTLRVEDPNADPRSVSAADPFRLEVGEAVAIAAQNLDDRLRLEVDGEVVLELDIERASNQQSRIEVVVEGGGADIADIEVFRDVYYISEGMRQSRWDIPAGHYVVLGDNTLDSADTRDWASATVTVAIDGSEPLELVGNSRRGENPWVDPSNPTHFFFRDQWGERWTFDPGAVTERTGGGALVPRQLVTGRALAVFWPLSWKYKVARLRWIH